MKLTQRHVDGSKAAFHKLGCCCGRTSCHVLLKSILLDDISVPIFYSYFLHKRTKIMSIALNISPIYLYGIVCFTQSELKENENRRMTQTSILSSEAQDLMFPGLGSGGILLFYSILLPFLCFFQRTRFSYRQKKRSISIAQYLLPKRRIQYKTNL